MTRRLLAENEAVKQRLINEAAFVEDRIRSAVRAVLQRDADLAAQVVAGDLEVDRLEVDIEQECLDLLLLQQPMADQFRFLVTCIKVNAELENIADYGVNIAKRAEWLATIPAFEIPFDLEKMSDAAIQMLRISIDALVKSDGELAKTVRPRDEFVDLIYRQAIMTVEEQAAKQPSEIDRFIRILAVAQNLERIADVATSIAENVVYMIEGRIARHVGARSRQR